jgi:hypothetical protein
MFGKLFQFKVALVTGYLRKIKTYILYKTHLSFYFPYHGKIGRQKILNAESGNNLIRQTILSSDHFFIGRLGGMELKAMKETEELSFGMRKKYTPELINGLKNNAGMFTNSDEGIRSFSKLMVKSLGMVTELGCWGVTGESYFVSQYAKNARLFFLGGLDSYIFSSPWTSALRGKKVLVVSPFSDSIKKQFEKRKLLFQNPDTLPDFTLLTVKAVQSIGGTDAFPSWNDALISMYNECVALDFDIAILGCGSYGFPLAGMLFSAGKSVIHAGGVTQMYFGVMGKRWETTYYGKKHIGNQYWVHPSSLETPPSAKRVENSCYW